MHLPPFSIGIGDRFGHQGQAQLKALATLQQETGVAVAPVWNKSFREHSIVGTTPDDVRREADAAVAAAGWRAAYFVDADHISLKNVDGFLAASDFFTLDVADWIGQPAAAAAVTAFVTRHSDLVGPQAIAGLAQPLVLTRDTLAAAASTYLAAAHAAGDLYRHITSRKGPDTFVTEVSMDETTAPQTPAELLVILAALADEGVPAQTLAPKFCGRFNKGVDYVGDPLAFAREFEDDLAVIRHAVTRFGLPAGLKLSVHSGSDKFSIYPAMAAALRRTGSGLHLKTAGTTWLEEVIGLAEADGEGLTVVREIYRHARPRLDELCAPYAAVVDIQPAHLPDAEVMDRWTSVQCVAALRHVPSDSRFNRDLRQFLHVAYKVAAELGDRYHAALETHANIVSRNVCTNLLDRHLRPLFGSLARRD